LSGAQSPVYRFNSSDDEQDSFAREARFFTELLVLHRDVDVVFEGIDKSKNFFGTVICNGKNLSVALLKDGLATFVDWSAAKTSNIDELKAAEKYATFSPCLFHCRGEPNQTIGIIGRLKPKTLAFGINLSPLELLVLREILAVNSALTLSLVLLILSTPIPSPSSMKGSY